MIRSQIRPIVQAGGPGDFSAQNREITGHSWVVDEKNKKHELTLTKTHLLVDGCGFVLSEMKCVLRREQRRPALLLAGILLAVVGVAVIFVRGMWWCFIDAGHTCSGFWDPSVPGYDYAVVFGVCELIAGIICVVRFRLLRKIVIEIPGLPAFTVKSLSPEFPDFWLMLATSIGLDASQRPERLVTGDPPLTTPPGTTVA